MGCLIARQNGLHYFDKSWKLALFCVVLANLPDVDYFFGIVKGAPNLYHRQFTHSLGFALAIGVLCGLFFYWRGHRFWPLFALSSIATYSHVALDFFGLDTSAPHGVIALWPLSQAYFMSPVPIFSNLIKGDTISGFVKAVFKLHNVLALIREIVVFAVLLVLQNWFIKNRLAFSVMTKKPRAKQPDTSTVRENY